MQLAGYMIQEKIGMGGMGEVYKAFHPGLNRVAAIKILHQKDMAERFRNEAYIQSSVNHPHIAKLYEYLDHGDKPCIIMEYVEGFPLDDYIARKGRLGNEETEKIISQVASALSYLHQKDILHRDIKPQNFKIDRDGNVKMLDFGISKNKYTPKLTQLGFVVGTTEYMAPEQFQQQVEKKSDIWSLGVMTYEMLTGHMPFDSNNVFSLRAQIVKASFTDPRILVPQISDKLATIVDRCLKINPAARMSAREIEDLLNGRQSSVSADMASWMNRIKVPKQRVLFYGVGLAVVVIMIFLLANLPSNKQQEADIPYRLKPDSVKLSNDQQIRMQINVPGIPGATIQLPDGSIHPVPYTISGNEGQRIDFILRAEGYHEFVQKDFVFNNRRSSYAVNLKKKNN